jgi:hypothetical protein
MLSTNVLQQAGSEDLEPFVVYNKCVNIQVKLEKTPIFTYHVVFQ